MLSMFAQQSLLSTVLHFILKSIFSLLGFYCLCLEKHSTTQLLKKKWCSCNSEASNGPVPADLEMLLPQKEQRRCPNLLSVTLSGCGHVTDDCILQLLKSCPKLRSLKLENCVRISDQSLEAVTLHGASLRTLHVDFCRNVTRAGLDRVRARCPSVMLRADRSAGMIPDSKPGKKLMLEKASRKLVQL